jgi:hypothetical protein
MHVRERDDLERPARVEHESFPRFPREDLAPKKGCARCAQEQGDKGGVMVSHEPEKRVCAISWVDGRIPGATGLLTTVLGANVVDTGVQRGFTGDNPDYLLDTASRGRVSPQSLQTLTFVLR